MTEILKERAQQLGLHGLVLNWEKIKDHTWVSKLIDWEEAERKKRGLLRRLKEARIGRFKSMADFDWHWPKKINHDQVEELFNLKFLAENENVIIMGPNAVGKTMIAQNIAYHAVLNGYSVRFTTASQLLNDFAAQEGASAFRRCLRRYYRPALLVIDELGYLSYDNRYADILFEVVNQRYSEKSIIITTNQPFAQWNEVFPNATCVVTLVDRLVHHSEIITIAGDSYRLKEAKERSALKATQRSKYKKADNKKNNSDKTHQ